VPPNPLQAIKRRVCDRLGIAGEPHWLRLPAPILRRIKNGGPISLVDLGAHKGSFTIAMSHHYEIARGILVEPLPHLAEALRQNFPMPAHQIFECAVSDERGTASFEMTEDEFSSSLLKIKSDLPALAQVPLAKSRKLQVQVRTLDDIASEAGLEKIDLLKVDVQGAEYKVFAGAGAALEMTNAIWVEVSYKPLYEGAPTFWDIHRQLDDRFRMVDMQPAFRAPDNEIVQSDLLFLRR
jgi:FkbM family methyltransferase